MKRKYVKIFEELDNSELQNLNEAPEPIDPPENETPEDETPDEDETPIEIPKYADDEPVTSAEDKFLRPGQKRARKLGNDILRRCEYAACYLNAKNNNSSQDTRRPGDTSLTRTALAMGRDADEDWTRIPAVQLSKYIDLKPATIGRTVGKFKYLIGGGDPAGVKGESMWDDFVSMFRRFERMPEASVRALAEEAFTGEVDTTRYETYLATANDQAKKSLLNKKATNQKIFDKVYSLYKGLKDAKDPATGRKKYDEIEAARKAVLRVERESIPPHEEFEPAGEPEWDRERIVDVMVELSKKDPVIQRYFRTAFKKTAQQAPAQNITVGPGQDQPTV